jgi:hypothetical protein
MNVRVATKIKSLAQFASSCWLPTRKLTVSPPPQTSGIWSDAGSGRRPVAEVGEIVLLMHGHPGGRGLHQVWSDVLF